ncbi:MAG: TlpA family protein disulfide reductase, partial [Bdellovibrionales bacterium]|nr:TlpA family protein disulfide reductase [Bdellovibrionales bacterium]
KSSLTQRGELIGLRGSTLSSTKTRSSIVRGPAPHGPTRPLNLYLVFILIALAPLFLFGCVNKPRETIEPGGTPPGFKLQDLDGAFHSLDKYQGNVVLLNFWATWCVPCITELPSIQQLYAKFKESGFIVVAVAVDDNKESLIKFKEKYALTFPILLDTDGSVKSAYKITGVPESFVINQAGRFSLISDPQSRDAAVRIVGPRDWSSAESVLQIESLLSQKN